MHESFVEERREGGQPPGGGHALDLWQDQVRAFEPKVDGAELVEQRLGFFALEVRRQDPFEVALGVDFRRDVRRQEPWPLFVGAAVGFEVDPLAVARTAVRFRRTSGGASSGCSSVRRRAGRHPHR